MDQATAEALDQLKIKEIWTAEDHKELLSQLFNTTFSAQRFREFLADMVEAAPEPTPADYLKFGMGKYMLCKFEEALEALENATDNKDRYYFAAMSYRGMRNYEKAIESFKKAGERGWDQTQIDVLVVETLFLANRIDQALEAMDKLMPTIEGTADAAYLTGLKCELCGYRENATNEEGREIVRDCQYFYELAREREESHSQATFRLASYFDRYGEDDQAIELYEECLCHPPVHANVLINLAILHDDAGEYDEAIACIRRLLETCPNHPRARLILKDSNASTEMYYDEDRARQVAKRNAVLDIPVTDFELSVRARNCLKKMDIESLGDLVRTSEAELLGYKNFGETSLREIKEMLSAKNLRLGQALEEGSDLGRPYKYTPPTEEYEDDGVRSTLISQVEFSVRSRRVLEQLNCHTLGELASKSEAELMSMKNFGQTSLNEMRQRLEEYGLSFRESR